MTHLGLAQFFDCEHLAFNPLQCSGNYSATPNYMKLVHWPLMGALLHMVQRGGPSPPSALLAISNVTAHPRTASVPITNHRIVA